MLIRELTPEEAAQLSGREDVTAFELGGPSPTEPERDLTTAFAIDGEGSFTAEQAAQIATAVRERLAGQITDPDRRAKAERSLDETLAGLIGATGKDVALRVLAPRLRTLGSELDRIIALVQRSAQREGVAQHIYRFGEVASGLMFAQGALVIAATAIEEHLECGCHGHKAKAEGDGPDGDADTIPPPAPTA